MRRNKQGDTVRSSGPVRRSRPLPRWARRLALAVAALAAHAVVQLASTHELGRAMAAFERAGGDLDAVARRHPPRREANAAAVELVGVAASLGISLSREPPEWARQDAWRAEATGRALPLREMSSWLRRIADGAPTDSADVPSREEPPPAVVQALAAHAPALDHATCLILEAQPPRWPLDVHADVMRGPRPAGHRRLHDALVAQAIVSARNGDHAASERHAAAAARWRASLGARPEIRCLLFAGLELQLATRVALAEPGLPLPRRAAAASPELVRDAFAVQSHAEARLLARDGPLAEGHAVLRRIGTPDIVLAGLELLEAPARSAIVARHLRHSERLLSTVPVEPARWEDAPSHPGFRLCAPSSSEMALMAWNGELANETSALLLASAHESARTLADAHATHSERR